MAASYPENDSATPEKSAEAVDLKEAMRLLDQWTETPDAEKCPAFHDTMALLGKENSAGWVWAREIREERDFDAELDRQRDLAMQCIMQAEERAEALQAALLYIRTIANESGNPRTIIARIFDIATRSTRGQFNRAEAGAAPGPSDALLPNKEPDGWIVKDNLGAVELFLHHARALDAFNSWGSFIGPVFEPLHPDTVAQSKQYQCPINVGNPELCSAGCCLRCSDFRDGWNAALAAAPLSQPPSPTAPAQAWQPIETALRDAFPHFQDDAPVTPEAIKAIGREWTDMLMHWAPVPTSILFADQNGVERRLDWEDFESSAGWVIPDDAPWEVSSALPSTQSGGGK